MGRGKSWSKAELLLALNLYFKLPFGQQHSSNPKIITLADRLGRTTGSVNMKLNNFSALDPDLEQKGLSNYSKKDEEVWNEYWQDLDRLASLSEDIYEEVIEKEEEIPEGPDSLLDRVKGDYGTEEVTQVRRRRGQKFFREVLLTHYEFQCAVCRLKTPAFLDASHIIDWSDAGDRNLRVDPRNGILLCAIHHRAFDTGDLTIRPADFTVQLSPRLSEEETAGAQFIFQQFQGQEIFLPERLKPEREYLKIKSRD